MNLIKRTVTLIIFSCVVLTPALLFNPTNCLSKQVEKVVTLPRLTVVQIEIGDSCSSETSKVGDRVVFNTTEPVMAGGEIVISEGSMVFAEVTKSEPARFLGKSGELVINVQYTVAVDGQKVPLRTNVTEDGKDEIVATVALAAMCCWPGFIKGEKAECVKGSLYTVYVASDMNIRVVRETKSTD